MKSGIYLITNIINTKEYIGKAKNLKRRKYEHWSLLKNGKHNNRHLQNAYDKYGRDSFHFVVLEYHPIVGLVDREKWWIGLLDTMNPNGYNLLDPVDGRLGIKHTDEARQKIGDAHRGKVIPQEMKDLFSQLYKGNTIPNRHTHKKGQGWSEGSLRKRSISKSKDYMLVSPEGEEIQIRNLKSFCRENGLGYAGMNHVARGINKTYKGWKVDVV